MAASGRDGTSDSVWICKSLLSVRHMDVTWQTSPTWDVLNV